MLTSISNTRTIARMNDDRDALTDWDYLVTDITRERIRQEELREAGKFPFTCRTLPGLSEAGKLAVLVEEVGEVAKAINENAPLDLLRSELIQTATVAIAWVQALDEAIYFLTKERRMLR